jgi:VPDSG-CTERM motif
MKKTKYTKLAAVAAALTLASGASALAATTSLSATAPVIDNADIASYTGSLTDAGNVAGGFDPLTYIAHDRGAEGQTFTTGANATGYTLDAVTLQHVAYTSDTTFWTTGAGTGYVLRIGTTSNGGGVQPITSSTSETAPDVAFSPATGLPGTGTGTYVTLTLGTSLVLAPSTVYFFDVLAPTGQTLFWETNGTSTDVYAGGEATGSGGGGASDPAFVFEPGGDRVFHVNLVANPIIPPVPDGGSTLMLLGAALPAIGFLRRKLMA